MVGLVLLRHEVVLDPGPGYSDELGHLDGMVLLVGDDVDGHGPLVLRGDSGGDVD